jgi:hypothetical protein
MRLAHRRLRPQGLPGPVQPAAAPTKTAHNPARRGGRSTVKPCGAPAERVAGAAVTGCATAGAARTRARSSRPAARATRTCSRWRRSRASRPTRSAPAAASRRRAARSAAPPPCRSRAPPSRLPSAAVWCIVIACRRAFKVAMGLAGRQALSTHASLHCDEGAGGRAGVAVRERPHGRPHQRPLPRQQLRRVPAALAGPRRSVLRRCGQERRAAPARAAPS